MASRYLNFFGQKGLKGGLNVSDNPIIVPPEQMVIANNVAIAQTLARKKRGGLTAYHTGSYAGGAEFPASSVTPSASTAIRGLIQYWRYGSFTGEPSEDLFLHQGSKVWSIPNRTDPATDRTGALTLDSSGIPCYQVFEGILYFANTVTGDGYNKWNGLGVLPGNAETANPPDDGVPKFLRAHIGRMWAAGVGTFPFRLYYSAPLDAEDWSQSSDGGSLDFSYDGDPDGITAIFPPFQGRLFVATRRKIYEITGYSVDDFVVQPVTQGIGCISHNSVVATPNDVIFASDRGIHSLAKLITSDQSAVTFLSRDIQTLWVNLTNRSLLNRTAAIWEENSNSYIVTLTPAGSTQQTTTLVYNLEFGTWTVWDDLDARSVANILISDQSYLLCGREDGNIAFVDPSKRYDLSNTNGFPLQFKSGKIYPSDQIDTQWRVLSVTVLCSCTHASTFSVGWTMDTIDGQQSDSESVTIGNDTDVLGSTFILGQSRLGFGRFIPKRVTVEKIGYNFQLDIRASGQSNIEFYGWILEVDDADSHYNS